MAYVAMTATNSGRIRRDRSLAAAFGTAVPMAHQQDAMRIPTASNSRPASAGRSSFDVTGMMDQSESKTVVPSNRP
jgi:hypothetical protein